MGWRDSHWVVAALYAAAALAIAALLVKAGVPWNSDDAIPVLMSNDGRRGWFDLYYWGQDRFGGWPWKLASWLRWPFGFGWTPERLSLAKIAFTLLGGLIFPWRLGRAGWPAAVAWVLASTLLWRLPEFNRAVGQLYGIQGVLVVAALA
ncbi:MAG TPA: hypothetical protein VE549_03230, partial [Myxococcaceae bacterium]|nr:hypothetical protein [Myxococcaceae bacterium]